MTKDAHCTESLDQRPPVGAILRASYTTARRARSRLSLVTLLAALCQPVGLGLAPSTHAQTNTAPATESSEAEVETDANKQAQPTETEPPEPPLYRSREERDMSLLAKDVENETAVWLEAMEQPFLALYEQELTGQAVGAVLIINAEGQHSSWPTTSERIRMSLPEFGWNTLSTELPLPETRPIPKRPPAPKNQPEGEPSSQDGETSSADTTPAENNPDQEAATEPVTPAPGEDKEIFDASTGNLSDGSLPNNGTETNSGSDVAEQTEATEMKVPAEDIAVARLHAAINYLHQQGQFNIVLMGSGVGALRSVCFLEQLPEVNSTTQTRLVRAMVMVNARNRLPNDDRQLHKCLNTPEMPVLDLYVGREQRDQVEARERRKYANKKRYEVFQQMRLPEMARNTMLGENRLSRRVRGFLEQHARGIKVDNAIIKRQ